jgi:large subunit ribosomal protein L37Ae
MGNTKKVRSTGRFSSRYGVGIRKRMLKVEDKQHNLDACPFCGFKKVKRKAAGLFVCAKCGAKFTGGAYTTETLGGKSIKKIVAQKTLAAKQAEEAKIIGKPVEESSYADIEKEVSEAGVV